MTSMTREGIVFQILITIIYRAQGNRGVSKSMLISYKNSAYLLKNVAEFPTFSSSIQMMAIYAGYATEFKWRDLYSEIATHENVHVTII